MTNEQKEFEKFNFYRDRFEQHWNVKFIFEEWI